MKSKSIEGEVFGFINPNSYFPSALITAYRSDEKVFIKDFNLKIYEVENHYLEEVVSGENYIPAPMEMKMDKSKCAYATSSKNIFFDTHENILNKLKEECHKRRLPFEYLRRIYQFLESSS